MLNLHVCELNQHAFGTVTMPCSVLIHVEITCGNRTLRVEINLVRVEITLVRVIITLLSDIITLIRVKITLCV
jgi:hypothetical protein